MQSWKMPCQFPPRTDEHQEKLLKLEKQVKSSKLQKAIHDSKNRRLSPPTGISVSSSGSSSPAKASGF
jgi:hypothetical protein